MFKIEKYLKERSGCLCAKWTGRSSLTFSPQILQKGSSGLGDLRCCPLLQSSCSLLQFLILLPLLWLLRLSWLRLLPQLKSHGSLLGLHDLLGLRLYRSPLDRLLSCLDEHICRSLSSVLSVVFEGILDKRCLHSFKCFPHSDELEVANAQALHRRLTALPQGTQPLEDRGWRSFMWKVILDSRTFRGRDQVNGIEN